MHNPLMSQVTIIQHGFGPLAEALLDLSGPRHAAYAKRWGYRLLIERKSLAPSRPDGMWDKIALLNREAQAADDGELLVWMDYDCLIVRDDVPLTAAMPEGAEVGMCTNYGCVRGGTIFLRVNARTRALVAAVEATGPIPKRQKELPGCYEAHPEHEELALHIGLLSAGLNFIPLEARWNFGPDTVKPNISGPTELRDAYPVIEGFHTLSDVAKLALMRARLRELDEAATREARRKEWLASVQAAEGRTSAS